jgi:glycerol-3-phosphate dehydrogenase (NAD(P)+)
MNVSILGAGAWGTALAVQAARAGNAVGLWARNPDRAAAMAAKRENATYLPGVALSPQIEVTADPAAALADALFVLVCVPMQFLRPVLSALPDTGVPLIACAKGVERGTLRFPMEVIADVRPGVGSGVLSGPNFAHEIARGLPAAAVLASHDAALRQTAGDLLGTAGFRIYGGDDPMGVQVGGAAKNVISIAAGAVIGAGLGENARAALVTRGLAETGRLLAALGGERETLMGLAGLGDLVLTCTGDLSRNRRVGLALAQGKPLAAILAELGHVAEGVGAAAAVRALARHHGIDMPICDAVYRVLHEGLSPKDAVEALLKREPRPEGQ